MPRPAKPILALRKKPQQARSAHLVESILQAAVRVLEREGASAFTTPRVAEEAGVSVGSLYQYFPNKESILLRLQEREWSETGAMLEAIYEDARLSPARRIHKAMRAFFLSERAEAPLRRALERAAPDYHEVAHRSPAEREPRMARLEQLIAAAAPHLTPRRRRFASELYAATFSSLGKHVSEMAGSQAEVEAYADAAAEMFLAWLSAQKRPPSRRATI